MFLYLLISIDLLFFYLIFISRRKKFRFSYLISLEVFLILLVPHFIWLINNDYILNSTDGFIGRVDAIHVDNNNFFHSGADKRGDDASSAY